MLNPLATENERLRKGNTRCTKRLKEAELIICFQKKSLRSSGSSLEAQKDFENE
jgi:hypothetical protein